jgi:hypothetical protein
VLVGLAWPGLAWNEASAGDPAHAERALAAVTALDTTPDP